MVVKSIVYSAIDTLADNLKKVITDDNIDDIKDFTMVGKSDGTCYFYILFEYDTEHDVSGQSVTTISKTFDKNLGRLF